MQHKRPARGTPAGAVRYLSRGGASNSKKAGF
jgi:hypothetical protein